MSILLELCANQRGQCRM